MYEKNYNVQRIETELSNHGFLTTIVIEDDEQKINAIEVLENLQKSNSVLHEKMNKQEEFNLVLIEQLKKQHEIINALKQTIETEKQVAVSEEAEKQVATSEEVEVKGKSWWNKIFSK
ncbi:hypothetical protein QUF86_27475 [Peribacillus sp. NJ11]|uniref:hypothetical protein n=1 Tax=Peribacillus sp. NJ11 TaxID=3055861 RepID=UPI0025A2237C|nr:hypothetical protein [Peribacillus sp. NJ11]MDM5224400.1 hypothetical protein [Peribacillus sp. NJ11]